MTTFLSVAFIFTGGTFMFLASVGVVRMPDLLSRMQTATKASTLGAGCILLGLSFAFSDFVVTARALAGIAFFLLTAPVSAHMVARAAYLLGIQLWEGTIADELKGKYDLETRNLRSEQDPKPQ